MHEEGLFVEFHDGQNQFKVPFIMYGDFDAILKPAEGLSPNPEESYTKEINQHISLVSVCITSLLMGRSKIQ